MCLHCLCADSVPNKAMLHIPHFNCVHCLCTRFTTKAMRLVPFKIWRQRSNVDVEAMV